MSDVPPESDCMQVLDQLVKLLHLSYDELMLFERAYTGQSPKTGAALNEVVRGEIECQKGLLKIMLYISGLSRQQGGGAVDKAGRDA